MKKDTIKLLRLAYGIVTGIFAVVSGICFIAACISIYRSGGDQIYTVQKVAEAFSGIAGLVYFSLALIAGGLVLDLALPADSKKKKVEKNYAATLERLLEKRDIDTCDPALKDAILHERKLRKQDRILSLLLLAVGSLAFLFYGADPANFHQTEINASMTKAVVLLAAYLVVPFVFTVCTVYRGKRSLQKEIELVKQIPAGERMVSAPAKTSCRAQNVVRWVVLGAAVILLVYGFIAGGTADVLTKAVNICTECVGLG